MDRARLVDRFGRRVSTLRISLTDRCNFQCVYCVPPGDVVLPSKRTHLSEDELARVVNVAGSLGVHRYRLTGGEPLMRPDIVSIVQRLRRIEAVRELSITTNASLLARLARPLRSAGVDRLNISLDSLDPGRFAAVTRRRACGRVRAGIEAALDVGFTVKINVVAMAGMTEREICEFVRFAADHALEVRFLEFMPLCGSAWESDRVLPASAIRKVVRRHFDIRELPRAGEPARSFRIVGTRGRVGFVAPLSEPFCADCSRIRITAGGVVRTCLSSQAGCDLRPLLETGASDDALAEALCRAVWNKPAGSQFEGTPFRCGETRQRWTGGPLIRTVGG